MSLCVVRRSHQPMLLILLASLTALVSSSPAAAQVRAEVVVAGDAQQLTPILTDLAASGGVELSIVSAPPAAVELPAILEVPPPRDAGLLARAWVRIARPEALVVITDASGERVLVRRVPIAGSVGLVELESLAQIVAGSLEALRLGGHIGVERAELEAGVLPANAGDGPQADPSLESLPAASTAPTPSGASQVAADVEVLTNAAMWSTHEIPQFRVSARIRIGWRGGWRPALDLELGYLVPAVVGSGEVTARLEGAASRIAVSLRRAFGRTTLRLRIAGGVDMLHAEPRLAIATAFRPAPDSWSVLPIIELSAGAGYRVLPRVSLFMDVGLAVDLVDAVYVVERAGREEVVFDPFLIRPTLSLGLRVALDSGGD